MCILAHTFRSGSPSIVFLGWDRVTLPLLRHADLAGEGVLGKVPAQTEVGGGKARCSELRAPADLSSPTCKMSSVGVVT